MTTKETLTNFYTAFSNREADKMLAYYDDQVIFTDPAFGTLEGTKAKAMWKMLLSRGDKDTKISFEILESSSNTGKVNWVASYNYGPQKRKVVNYIKADIRLKDGKIIRHIDDFNLWKWSRQALGLPGLILGWSPMMKKKIQTKTNKMLDTFMKKQENLI